MYPHHFQITKIDATAVFFIEFLGLQFHRDPIFDSLYITNTCHFRLYFFARRDFTVQLFHPLFDLAALYIVTTLHMAHPAPPAAPPALPLPPQVIPSLSSESDPSEDTSLFLLVLCSWRRLRSG